MEENIHFEIIPDNSEEKDIVDEITEGARLEGVEEEEDEALENAVKVLDDARIYFDINMYIFSLV